VDVERAKNESPFGTTVAHGNLTLSMIDGFRASLLESTGFRLGVNYGWNKIRFPAPVPAGSRIRASVEPLAVDDAGGGWYQVVQRWTVEVEGSAKPACVAESVGRVLA
jgi:acyl dehydratase